jgi:hypothetical protein
MSSYFELRHCSCKCAICLQAIELLPEIKENLFFLLIRFQVNLSLLIAIGYILTI